MKNLLFTIHLIMVCASLSACIKAQTSVTCGSGQALTTEGVCVEVKSKDPAQKKQPAKDDDYDFRGDVVDEEVLSYDPTTATFSVANIDFKDLESSGIKLDDTVSYNITFGFSGGWKDYDNDFEEDDLILKLSTAQHSVTNTEGESQSATYQDCVASSVIEATTTPLYLTAKLYRKGSILKIAFLKSDANTQKVHREAFNRDGLTQMKRVLGIYGYESSDMMVTPTQVQAPSRSECFHKLYAKQDGSETEGQTKDAPRDAQVYAYRSQKIVGVQTVPSSSSYNLDFASRKQRYLSQPTVIIYSGHHSVLSRPTVNTPILSTLYSREISYFLNTASKSTSFNLYKAPASSTRLKEAFEILIEEIVDLYDKN